MAKTTIDPRMLGGEISRQLTLYHKDVSQKVNAVGRKAIKKIVDQTKATAPIRTGDFVDSITYTTDRNRLGDDTFTWGVNAPHYRLTHLLAKGHQNVDGTRTPGDPFLENALETVLPEYEQEVEEAIRNA